MERRKKIVKFLLICFFVFNVNCQSDKNKILTEDLEGLPLPKNFDTGLLKSEEDKKIEKRNLALMGSTFQYQFNNSQSFKKKPELTVPNNPKFVKSFHTSERNFFHLSMVKAKSQEALLCFQLFIKKWFDLDKKKESLFIENVKVNDTQVQNRFRVKYFDKDTYLSKVYYFDVNFLDNRANPKRYRKIQAQVAGVGSDSSFGNDYAYTLNTECLAIQKKMFNPEEIKCEPIVNKYGYVIFHAYKATMLYKRAKNTEVIEKTVFVTTKKKQVSHNLQPAKRIKGKKQKLPSVLSLIRFRMANMKSRVPYSVMAKYLRYRDVVKAAKKIRFEVAKSKNRIQHIVRNKERSYQKRLKTKLFNLTRGEGVKSKAFENTYELVSAKTAELNAFEVETSLKKSIKDLDFKTKYKAHQKKADHYAKELRMARLLDEYDYIRYIEDNDLDETFRLG